MLRAKPIPACSGRRHRLLRFLSAEAVRHRHRSLKWCGDRHHVFKPVRIVRVVPRRREPVASESVGGAIAEGHEQAGFRSFLAALRTDYDRARSDTLPALKSSSNGRRNFLVRVHELDPRLCRVVGLKLFAGLSIDETAETLQISTATVERDWTVSKAWLHSCTSGYSIRWACVTRRLTPRRSRSRIA